MREIQEVRIIVRMWDKKRKTGSYVGQKGESLKEAVSKLLNREIFGWTEAERTHLDLGLVLPRKDIKEIKKALKTDIKKGKDEEYPSEEDMPYDIPDGIAVRTQQYFYKKTPTHYYIVPSNMPGAVPEKYFRSGDITNSKFRNMNGG